MNIFMVIPKFHPLIGGMEKQVQFHFLYDKSECDRMKALISYSGLGE
jgi:hypothetical protein